MKKAAFLLVFCLFLSAFAPLAALSHAQSVKPKNDKSQPQTKTQNESQDKNIIKNPVARGFAVVLLCDKYLKEAQASQAKKK